MSERLAKTVEEFAEKMGFKDLNLSLKSTLAFDFERRGVLCVDPVDKGGAMLYMMRRYENLSPDSYKKAFKLCYQSNRSFFDLKVMEQEPNIVYFAAYLEETHLSRQNFEQVLDVLVDVHGQLFA